MPRSPSTFLALHFNQKAVDIEEEMSNVLSPVLGNGTRAIGVNQVNKWLVQKIAEVAEPTDHRFGFS